MQQEFIADNSTCDSNEEKNHRLSNLILTNFLYKKILRIERAEKPSEGWIIYYE